MPPDSGKRGGAGPKVLWRKLRLDWKYFVGELLIVTLGVLVALALDSWNDARLERGVEDQILIRIIADMEADTSFFAWCSENLDAKLSALDHVSVALAEPDSQLGDSLAFVEAVALGSSFGWDQPTVSRTTFDELVSSGTLGLINDSGMRRQLIEYYYEVEDSRERMNARRTGYPQIAYRLVPRSSEFSVSGDLEGDRLRQVIQAIRQSELSQHVQAEINLGRFIQSVTDSLDFLSRSLLRDFSAYRETR
jgi:hypothetical protein